MIVVVDHSLARWSARSGQKVDVPFKKEKNRIINVVKLQALHNGSTY